MVSKKYKKYRASLMNGSVSSLIKAGYFVKINLLFCLFHYENLGTNQGTSNEYLQIYFNEELTKNYPSIIIKNLIRLQEHVLSSSQCVEEQAHLKNQCHTLFRAKKKVNCHYLSVDL